jgi:hypothetical protein
VREKLDRLVWGESLEDLAVRFIGCQVLLYAAPIVVLIFLLGRCSK